MMAHTERLYGSQPRRHFPTHQLWVLLLLKRSICKRWVLELCLRLTQLVRTITITTHTSVLPAPTVMTTHRWCGHLQPRLVLESFKTASLDSSCALLTLFSDFLQLAMSLVSIQLMSVRQLHDSWDWWTLQTFWLLFLPITSRQIN